MSTTTADRMERWDRRIRPFIIVAAVAPFADHLIFGVEEGPVASTVDLVSWAIFLADLLVRLVIDRRYLTTGYGIFDLAIVLLTFPYYLIPGVDGTPFMAVFRLARLVRLFTATGLGRGAVNVMRRLGTLGIWMAVMSALAALMVLRAEPPESGFETFGDALWWALVSFTTVGYGDLFPVTAVGRMAGALMMFAGLAAMGTVAAVLGSALRGKDEEDKAETETVILDELRQLRSEVAELKDRLDG